MSRKTEALGHFIKHLRSTDGARHTEPFKVGFATTQECIASKVVLQSCKGNASGLSPSSFRRIRKGY